MDVINNIFLIQYIFINLENKIIIFIIFTKNNKYEKYNLLVNTFQYIFNKFDDKYFLFFPFNKIIKDNKYYHTINNS